MRTVLLDCGGLWALGDVLAETEKHKKMSLQFFTIHTALATCTDAVKTLSDTHIPPLTGLPASDSECGSEWE